MNRLALAALAAVLALAATLAASQAQAPAKVMFALNWFPVGDHAAYWVALDKGYYKARGLDVEMQNSKGSGDVVAKVDTNRMDIGLADVVVVIPRIAQGAKIKVVGAVFDHTPLNVFTRKETGITRPKDLEGKTLAAPPGDAQRQLFPAFAKLNGVDERKVTWVNIEPAAKMVALAKKRVDAVPDYTTGQPLFEKVFGEEGLGKDALVRMPWNQHGFDTYSMSIVASEKTIGVRPKVLRDFLAASYQGWRDVMENPRAAVEIFKKRVPEIEAGVIEANLLLGLELMKTDRYAKNGIGWIEKAKMCRTVELINSYMPGLPRKVGCDEVFTVEYLTKIDLPRR